MIDVHFLCNTFCTLVNICNINTGAPHYIENVLNYTIPFLPSILAAIYAKCNTARVSYQLNPHLYHCSQSPA